MTADRGDRLSVDAGRAQHLGGRLREGLCDGDIDLAQLVEGDLIRGLDECGDPLLETGIERRCCRGHDLQRLGVEIDEHRVHGVHARSRHQAEVQPHRWSQSTEAVGAVAMRA